jgi:hypothetical protein
MALAGDAAHSMPPVRVTSIALLSHIMKQYDVSLWQKWFIF